MKIPEEGPFERMLWGAMAVVTFGSIALSITITILGKFINRPTNFIDPVFVFGMAMIGVMLVCWEIRVLTKGERPDWLWLTIGTVWLLFFGRGFLRMVGILT